MQKTGNNMTDTPYEHKTEITCKPLGGSMTPHKNPKKRPQAFSLMLLSILMSISLQNKTPPNPGEIYQHPVQQTDSDIEVHIRLKK
jgi:hypothetical protein